MKLLPSLLIILFIASCGGSAYAGEFNILFDYDFTNDRPCQSASENSCLKQFVAYHYKDGARVIDATVQAPLTAVGAVNDIQTGFFPAKNIYGNVTFCVVAQAKDANGVIVESIESCVGATGRPGGVSNIREQHR